MELSPGKRKRDQERSMLPLNTQIPARLWLDPSDDNFDASSPRTKVARTFDDMSIHAQPLDQSVTTMSTYETNEEFEDGNIGILNVSRSAPDFQREMGTSQSCAAEIPASQIEQDPTPSKAPNSPPMSTPADPDLYWQDAEITGHDPKDPHDDGYGINGVGFRPTPAMAWSRSQARRKQLAEWRTREAKEDRDRRRERRKRGPEEDITKTDAASELQESPRKAVRVRFDDG